MRSARTVHAPLGIEHDLRREMERRAAAAVKAYQADAQRSWSVYRQRYPQKGDRVLAQHVAKQLILHAEREVARTLPGLGLTPVVQPDKALWREVKRGLVEALENVARQAIGFAQREAARQNRQRLHSKKRDTSPEAKAKRRAGAIAQHSAADGHSKALKRAYGEAGVISFIWRTRGDKRVRSTHQVLDGKEFPFPEGAPGEGLPGEPFRCRCSLEPVPPPEVPVEPQAPQLPPSFSQDADDELKGEELPLWSEEDNDSDLGNPNVDAHDRYPGVDPSLAPFWADEEDDLFRLLSNMVEFSEVEASAEERAAVAGLIRQRLRNIFARRGATNYTLLRTVRRWPGTTVPDRLDEIAVWEDSRLNLEGVLNDDGILGLNASSYVGGARHLRDVLDDSMFDDELDELLDALTPRGVARLGREKDIYWFSTMIHEAAHEHTPTTADAVVGTAVEALEEIVVEDLTLDVVQSLKRDPDLTLELLGSEWGEQRKDLLKNLGTALIVDPKDVSVVLSLAAREMTRLSPSRLALHSDEYVHNYALSLLRAVAPLGSHFEPEELLEMESIVRKALGMK